MGMSPNERIVVKILAGLSVSLVAHLHFQEIEPTPKAKKLDSRVFRHVAGERGDGATLLETLSHLVSAGLVPKRVYTDCLLHTKGFPGYPMIQRGLFSEPADPLYLHWRGFETLVSIASMEGGPFPEKGDGGGVIISPLLAVMQMAAVDAVIVTYRAFFGEPLSEARLWGADYSPLRIAFIRSMKLRDGRAFVPSPKRDKFSPPEEPRLVALKEGSMAVDRIIEATPVGHLDANTLHVAVWKR